MIEPSHSHATQVYALNIRHLALASIVPLTMMLVAMSIKPLWRDEYWSLYYSSPQMSLHDLSREVHPPIYYYILRLWQTVVPGDFAARILSLLFAGAGAMAVWSILRPKRLAATFLLLAVGSYWIIYFATEVRAYVLLYSLCAVSTVAAYRIVETQKLFSLAPVLLISGLIMGMTHYFGALWHAALCFCIGLQFLIGSRNLTKFWLIGLIGLCGIAPTVSWIWFSLSNFDLSKEISGRPFIHELEFALNQFLRGFIVKWIGSNPAAFIGGCAGLWAALKIKYWPGAVLVYACILTVIVSFVLHFTFLTFIKERAYIVIFPALSLQLAVWLSQQEGAPSRAVKLTPIFAVIMPALFIPEYFKDREQLAAVTKYLQEHEDACSDFEIYGYFRPSNHDGFSEFVTERVTNAVPNLRVINVESSPGSIESSDCPIKAVALLLPRGDSEWREVADEALSRAGVTTENSKTIEFGSGRSVIWKSTSTK